MEEVREQDRLMFEDLRKDFDDGAGQPGETFEDFVNRFESEIEGYLCSFNKKTLFFGFHSTLFNACWMNVVVMTSIILGHVK